MKHLDLFSGIGGFALAMDTVWKKIEHIFCDNDLFCQQVLKKHWPQSKIYGDIRELKGAEIGSVDIITGGFPCQPFSSAGNRRGKEDDRDLWPEMFRIISEVRPRWVIGENVANFVNMELKRTVADLEGADYEVELFIIPACAINAPHIRNRVWIIAYRKGERIGSVAMERKPKQENVDVEWKNKIASAHTASKRHGGGGYKGCEIKFKRIQPKKQKRNKIWGESERCDCDAPNSETTGLEGTIGSELQRFLSAPKSWERNWPDVAAEFCGVDDGLPAKLDGFKLSKSKHRKERLKSLGNSIVPQVAVEIFKAIKVNDVSSN